MYHYGITIATGIVLSQYCRNDKKIQKSLNRFVPSGVLIVKKT